MTVSGQPSRLAPAPGHPGISTEWDASTLEGAITWLETHSRYLGGTLAPGMESDIRDWLLPPPGGASPFGTFPTALDLSQRHIAHYTAADASVRSVATELWQAAQALRVVLDQYKTAEEANELSASSFDQIFTSQAAPAAGRYPAATAVPASATPASATPVSDVPVTSTVAVEPAVHTTPYEG
ncbi:hypothetical protein [Catenuloplanes atrovinosus]|uniref:PE domain-containing protein n=1 Tax=Catenuloplanes atrovinosus TaxID=137266 RepID=A0AAE3YSQ9_9ACTN|nr:hypothetical protein [Catenuloplanes atrovinosus]MDR7278542.1 hypothetical protein [Catenuloplanes atrovinosus]